MHHMNTANCILFSFFSRFCELIKIMCIWHLICFVSVRIWDDKLISFPYSLFLFSDLFFFFFFFCDPYLLSCCSNLFSDVINCIQTDNLELKKLVYLYLMNYAKTQPELAIMAVNTFVKVCLTE